jgi:hypothetical protein
MLRKGGVLRVWIAAAGLLTVAASAQAAPMCTTLSRRVEQCSATFTTLIPAASIDWGPAIFAIQGFNPA